MRERQARSILKGLTWRVFATIDTVILAYLFTGSINLALSIGGLEVLTKTFLYYMHERLWLVVRGSRGAVGRQFTHHAHGRSMLKAISWRIFGALDTFIVSLVLTRRLVVSGSIGGAELLTKVLLYYLHERLWLHVSWGAVPLGGEGAPEGLRSVGGSAVPRSYYDASMAALYGIGIVLMLSFTVGAAYVLRPASVNVSPASVTIARMEITSSAFGNNASIPSAYTCDASLPPGANASPELFFRGVPAGAKSLALIVEDTDVPKELNPEGVFDHWVLFNLPPGTASLPEGGGAGVAGTNSAGGSSYVPPCPPSGYAPAEHRYFFTLYALDAELPLGEGATKAQVLEAMQGHIIAQASLTGRYERRQTSVQ